MEESLFGDLSSGFAGNLMPSRVQARLEEERSCSEGDKPEGVFVLRSGRVKLSAGSVDGKSLVVRRAEPGEVVGLPAAISGKPYELTAEAMETIEYSFIVREAFLSFLRQHGQAALRMAEILSDTYEATLHQVRYLGLSASTAEKIARFLLELRCFEDDLRLP
jgi:CRP/FNR family transcriptional regulator, cyclic AMP receptor protein